MGLEKYNAGNNSLDNYKHMVTYVMANMKRKTSPHAKATVLLAGDPGVGKTSFVRFLSKLLGIELLTIEVPHLTEEHLINIPFIIFNPGNDSESKQDNKSDLKDPKFEVHFAESNLRRKLVSAHKISDAQYLKSIYSGPKNLIQVFESLGGDEKTIPKSVQQLRDHYKVILFVDEYYRKTSVSIRNILRGFLNGKIGMDDLPNDVYFMYASNMNDGDALDEIPSNADYRKLNMDAPDAEDWFSWLVSKFEKDKDVELSEKIVDEFHELLKDNKYLSNNHFESDVRASPRRWEQVLLYVNAAFPIKDREEAISLLTNVKTMFMNYQTGAQHEIVDGLSKTIVKLVKEISGIEISTDDKKEVHQWKGTLQHQIEQKKKLGKNRSYIPVVSGPPGIGKTTAMSEIAADEDLRLIYVDCQSLSAEDVIGTPIPSDNKKELSTSFSKPKLYSMIMDKIKAADQAYLKASGVKKGEYDKRRWKYLIFFDELNRTKTKTFNAIRQVLLEKTFGDNLDIPEESIIVGAINPHDLGATDFTSHMRDVLDVIDSHADWSETKKYIETVLKPKGDEDEERSFNLVKNLVFKMVNKFKTRQKVPGPHEFYLEIGSDDPLYISPREYSDMVQNTVEHLAMSLPDLNKKLNQKDGQQKIHDGIVKIISTGLMGTLEAVMDKHHVSAPEFTHKFQGWVENNLEVKDLKDLLFDESKEGVVELKVMLNDIVEKPGEHLANDQAFNNYLENVSLTQFTHELEDYLMTWVDDPEKIDTYFVHKKHPSKSIDDEKVVTGKETTTMIDFIMKEILHAVVMNEKTYELLDPVKQAITTSIDKVYEKLDKEVSKLEDAADNADDDSKEAKEAELEEMQDKLISIMNYKSSGLTKTLKSVNKKN